VGQENANNITARKPQEQLETCHFIPSYIVSAIKTPTLDSL
jgi:hypothetical protein